MAHPRTVRADRYPLVVTESVGWVDGGFHVSDDGPGVPLERRASVLQPGHTTGEDGTGLGLAIVKRIADAHGASVCVTESETGGTRFEIAGFSTASRNAPTSEGHGDDADTDAERSDDTEPGRRETTTASAIGPA